MDRRTIILSGLFGAVLAYVLLSSVVYPQWIEPQLTIEDRIADLHEQYDELYEQKKKVDDAAERYRALVARVGSFDIGKVETDLRARLNELIDKHQLENANVSPTRPTEDRKTGLQKMMINVTATGKLKGAVEFMKEVAELPQLIRVGNAAVYPASKSRKGARNRMNLRVPLEVMVLPPKRRIVDRSDEDSLVQPESYQRHAGLDYSLIWSRKPFMEPIPLTVNAGRDVTKKVGQSTRLKATASGGDGEYVEIKWEPEEGLDDPTSANPTVDTSTDFTRDYTVTYVDSSGETASDSVTVTIREKIARGKEKKPKPPKPQEPDGPQRWKDRKYMQLCMVLMRSSEAGEFGELMIHNKQAKQTEYYTIGDEFDGGNLVSVQPRGGVVRREDKYFAYPIGGWLDQDFRVEDAIILDEYPELRTAAEEHREQFDAQQEVERKAVEEAKPAVEGEAAADATAVLEEKDAVSDKNVAAPESPEGNKGSDEVEPPGSTAKGLQGAAGKAQRIKGKNAGKAKSGAAEKPGSRTSDKAIAGDQGNAKDQDKGKDKPRRVPRKVQPGSLKDKRLRPLKRASKKKDP